MTPREHGAPIPLTVNPDTVRADTLRPAVEWLASGGIVAFPTDTFYGLAVDPGSDAAVQALFDLKGRGADAALPLVASSAAQVAAWAGPLGAIAAALADAFWPGPLSLVFDAPDGVSAAVHGGRGSVAVRVPAHAVARALAEAWGGPITATSANRSGHPPARTVAELDAVGADARVLVIDGGATPGGAPSTIVDARGARPHLVRDGAIAWARVLSSIKR